MWRDAELILNWCKRNECRYTSMTAPIGIFDSGVGGLTVYKEIRRLLPSEPTIYLGDTARVPYGIRSPETVVRYSLEALQFFADQRVKLVVVACNTVSAVALSILKKESTIPTVGVIEHGAARAVQVTETGRVGVIGTETTVRSGAYRLAIFQNDPRVDVFEQACPLFVPLVEEGWTRGSVALEVAGHYLKRLKKARIDTLLLGCTHYPLLKSVIRKAMGNSTHVVDSAREVAKEVQKVLQENGIANRSSKVRSRFYVTDAPDRFRRIGHHFLGHPLPRVQKTSLF
jgi:glutamate racemase